MAQNTYVEPEVEQRIDSEEFVVAETQQTLEAPEVPEEHEAPAPVDVDPNRPKRRKKS